MSGRRPVRRAVTAVTGRSGRRAWLRHRHLPGRLFTAAIAAGVLARALSWMDAPRLPAQVLIVLAVLLAAAGLLLRVRAAITPHRRR